MGGLLSSIMHNILRFSLFVPRLHVSLVVLAHTVLDNGHNVFS